MALGGASAVRFLGRERLEQAMAVYGAVATIHQIAVEGRQPEALALLAKVVGLLPAEIIEVERVLRTQEQTAQALHATQRTLAPFIGRREPKEQLNPANDIGHRPTPAPPPSQ